MAGRVRRRPCARARRFEDRVARPLPAGQCDGVRTSSSPRRLRSRGDSWFDQSWFGRPAPPGAGSARRGGPPRMRRRSWSPAAARPAPLAGGTAGLVAYDRGSMACRRPRRWQIRASRRVRRPGAELRQRHGPPRPAFGRDATISRRPPSMHRGSCRRSAGAPTRRAGCSGASARTASPERARLAARGRGTLPARAHRARQPRDGRLQRIGYAYLGRHLASRGFIAGSVDENFLNGSWADDGRAPSSRASLAAAPASRPWRTWNDRPVSPFHGSST